MHELSVCEDLMRKVLDVAASHGAQRVERVVLRIGPLSGVEPHLLADAFPFISAGTVAEGAELVIEMVGVRVRCAACGAETETQPSRLVCGACGDQHTQLLGGDESMLVSVELSGTSAAAIQH